METLMQIWNGATGGFQAEKRCGSRWSCSPRRCKGAFGRPWTAL